jgi:hypothetical protein
MVKNDLLRVRAAILVRNLEIVYVLSETQVMGADISV